MCIVAIRMDGSRCHLVRRHRLCCVRWEPISPTEWGTAAPTHFPARFALTRSPISAAAEHLLSNLTNSYTDTQKNFNDYFTPLLGQCSKVKVHQEPYGQIMIAGSPSRQMTVVINPSVRCHNFSSVSGLRLPSQLQSIAALTTMQCVINRCTCVSK